MAGTIRVGTDYQEFVKELDLAENYQSRQNGDNARWHILLAIGLIVIRFVGSLCVLSVSDSGNGEKMENTVGMRIKERRLAMGFTQEELAMFCVQRNLPYQPTSLARMMIKVGVLREMAPVLGTTVAYLAVK